MTTLKLTGRRLGIVAAAIGKLLAEAATRAAVHRRMLH